MVHLKYNFCEAYRLISKTCDPAWLLRFCEKSLQRVINHQINAFFFSQTWSINYMWLYLVNNIFFSLFSHFVPFVQAYLLTMRRQYNKRGAMQRKQQFVSFWPSWCVEAGETFLSIYKKRNFEILRHTVLLFTKIRWGQKVSI